MTISRQTPQWWKKLLWILCLWQALVFVLAGLYHLIGTGAKVPILSEAEERELTSLLRSTGDDQQKSLSAVNQLLGTHRRAVQLWQEAVYQLLDGKDTESVLSKLEEQAPRSPKFYDDYTRWLLTNFWRKTRGELIITAAGYGCTNENVLAGIDSLREGPITDKEAARNNNDAKSLALILRANFTGAAKSMAAESGVLLERGQKTIASALNQLEKAPGDFERRLQLAESLFSYARTGRFTVGYANYCWNLWDEARTLEQRAAVLYLLGRIYERDEDLESMRILYSAGVQLSSGLSAVGSDRQSLLLKNMAYSEGKAANYLVAASLYQDAAERTRDKSVFGTCEFNRGSLLREAGYAQAAAKVLSELIESDVNDQDPSGHLSKTYQNYRNESARLIALTYRDRGNLPMLYYWRYKTARQYPYQSWCGTCLESYHWDESISLLEGAALAGPIFFTANLMIFPGRYWFLWLLLLCCSAFIWRRKRKMRQMP